MNDEQSAAEGRIDRLLDAIDLLKDDRREDAVRLLRELIQEDNNFEDAWLWMGVAVESLDQSAICLDNALRINPQNAGAASALYRIRHPEMLHEQQRGRIRFWRDLAFTELWLLVVGLLCALPLNFFWAWR
jgi:tetratricopeptide (TPR) repeat protein